jgi:hypothetical protein
LKKIERNKKFSLFNRLKELKEIFCAKVIIKLDSIIIKCSDKNHILKVQKELEDAEEIKNFSKQFNENKELLRDEIYNLKDENEYLKCSISSLFEAYKFKDYEHMSKIFSNLGLTNKTKFIKDKNNE